MTGAITVAGCRCGDGYHKFESNHSRYLRIWYDFGAATSYNRPNEKLDFAVKLGMK